MWICNHCHAENKDGYTACEQCGTIRSAGRFGSAPTALNARPPQVSAPAVNHAPARYAEPSAAQARQMPPHPPAPRAIHKFGKAVGGMLLVLLPALCALLAWKQYDVLSPVLVGLLVEADAAEMLKLVLYIGWALIALLLSMVPGLHILLQCPSRPKKKKKRK